MDRPWKLWILYTAAAWNILGGVMALASPAKHFSQMYTTSLNTGEPLAAFFYRCVWINVIAWGLAYALAARWPDSRKAVLIAGSAGKVVYAAACAALFASGVGKPMVAIAGVVDLLLAAGFAAVLLHRR